MSALYRTTPARGGALTSTCRACGATHTAPNYSEHRAWRDAHQLECDPPDDGGEAA